ncbi:serpin B9-like [Callospermophilus lateralis]|uniref:serpin B9-like isoform X1 n=1 Tax=Callospermophilus lateralis TaxID=76772 RepID=UPI004038F397
MDSLSKANGTFAIQVLKMLCQDRPSQNVFFSPLSISSALAMMLLGAKGNTKDQMAQALSLNTEEDIHEGFQMLLNQVHNPGSKYLLTTANRLFGEKNCDFFSTFKESCLQFYHSEMELLSFIKDSEKSREHINAWVSKETKGKIPEMLPVNSIDELVRLVLVNAIYFQGMWDKPFDKSCTEEMAFKVNQEEKRTVQMMWQEDNFNFIYISEFQTKLVELPYAGKTLSMIILLPDEDLSVVENNLTFEKFIAWTKAASLQNIGIEVLLSRFKLQEDYDMQSVLQRLGMVDAFQHGQADFSGMSTETDLCLSKVVHKSVVEVNEEGTEAAAADIDEVFDCTSWSPKFCADHPFLFFIRHNRTNTLLFCGRFSCP